MTANTWQESRIKRLEEENEQLRAQIREIHANRDKPLREDQRRELIESFKVKEETLLKELKHLHETLHNRNWQLDKLHYIWCTGCESGAHRFSENDLTEEKLLSVMATIHRTRTWFMNHKGRSMELGEYQAWKKHFLDKVKWYVD